MATLDILLRLKEMPTWDRGTRLSDFGFDGGGPVGTAMVAAAKLGVRAGFIGTAGNDVAAQLKMQSFIEANVDLSRMVYRESPDDQVIVVFVHEESGERVFAGVDRPARQPLRPDELDYNYITQADYLHLDGFHAEAALQAARWMRDAGKTVVLDAGKTQTSVPAHLRALIPYVDILISGSGFVQSLTGKTDLWEACETSLALGPRVVVQTEGEQGSYTVTAEEKFHTPAFSCEVVDTTGAGDVFHGAYIVGLIQGWSLHEIASFATAASAIKCTRLGGRAGIPTWDDVMVFLAQHGIDLPDKRRLHPCN